MKIRLPKYNYRLTRDVFIETHLGGWTEDAGAFTFTGLEREFLAYLAMLNEKHGEGYAIAD